MICNKCGKENKSTNIRCEYCGNELNTIDQNYNQVNIKQIDLSSKKVGCLSSAVLIFFLAPWFLIGLVFIGVSAYSSITDYNQSKNYLQVDGKLVGYENCEYDDGSELCNAVYEYVVNGKTYQGSPNLLSNKSGFKSTAVVKYNPSNPSEYVMNSGWNSLLIVGIIMVIISSAIFISIKLKMKNVSKKLQETNVINQ